MDYSKKLVLISLDHYQNQTTRVGNNKLIFKDDQTQSNKHNGVIRRNCKDLLR